MTDEAFDRYMQIWTAVHALVDEMLADMSDEDAEDIRDKLTDEYRFWKLL